MLVNIERAIKNIREEIGFFQPLYEGIINAFQVNADRLDINFDIGADDNITGYSIKDNGEGFTDKNIENYLTLWGEYHLDQGALGSGRIMCLKVFDNIIIQSQTKNIGADIGQKISINFNKSFTPNSVSEVEKDQNSSDKSWTTTKFKNIVSTYPNKENAFDRTNIEENIFIALLPMFIRFKEEQKDFKIFIENSLWIDKQGLKQKINDYDLETKEFEIADNNGEQQFTLTYRIKEDGGNQLEQFYGAADRNIIKFPKKTAIEQLDDGYSGIFCLTSNYFEERVKDSRNDFTLTFNQNIPNAQHPITFPAINEKLRTLLDEILIETFPKIQQKFNVLKGELVNTHPYLSRYIKANKNLTISKNNLLKEAEKEFIVAAKSAKSKADTFIKKLKENTNNFDEKNYQKIKDDFTKAGADKLAEYIAYRQTIIKMLQTVNNANLEKDIHNLFMQQHTESKTSSENNIWIFDDKFMSYNYAASDMAIKNIINNEKIHHYHGNKKPDLIMFYSNNEDKNKNVLLIEFKRLGGNIDDKSKALTQLKRYPSIIREYDKNILSIFAYTIIDIDDEFRHELIDTEGFSENAFGDEDNKISAYYSYNGNVKAHLNVVSFSQVLQDANKRNTVFLDILKEKYEQSI